jgi:Ca-activated chloride channel homolog
MRDSCCGPTLRRYLLVTLAIAAAKLAGAPALRGQSPSASGDAAATPTLLARASSADAPQPLVIDRAAVEVAVAGLLARTQVTLTFRNPHDRDLEGELVFPLPEGATVSGYGLDIDGQVVDAVVVESGAARVAFEAEERRRIDPGLVEWRRGSSFRTRVWPVPRHGERTVRVEYLSELAVRSEGGSTTAAYTLPLRLPEPVAELRVRLEVAGSAGRPQVLGTGPSGIEFTPSKIGFVADTTLQAVAWTADLAFAFPVSAAGRALVEVDEKERAHFVIDDFVDDQSGSAPPSPAPARVGLVWDASLSRVRADTRREITLVAGWLQSLGDVEVDLTVVRDVAENKRRFELRGGDTSEIVAHLSGLAYDGATRLDRLSFDPDCDYHVLVSDGIGTIGAPLPEISSRPVYVLSSDPLADHNALKHIAQASGGQYFNLHVSKDEEVLSQLGRPALSLLAVRCDQGQVADVVAPARRVTGGRMALSGRLVSPEARITLLYGWQRGSPTTRRSFVLQRPGKATTGLVARLWAQRRIADLSLWPEKNHEELLQLGRQYGLVTPGTSLLVLETLEQYLRHRIEPPASRAAMRESYLRQVSELVEDPECLRQDKIEQVVPMWQKRMRWWRRKPGDDKAESDEQPEARVPAASREGAGRGSVSIRGRVTDPSGGLAVGAAVTITNTLTGAEAQAQTGSDGTYEVRGLATGRYRIVCRVPGFKTTERRVRTACGGSATVDLRVEVASMAETIVVDQEIGAAYGGGDSAVSASSIIALKPWDPQTPYLSALKQAAAAETYAVYLTQRGAYGNSPSFFLDCADHFLKSGRRDLGVRILTDVVEMMPDEPRLQRIAAHRLQQIGELALAVDLFEKVLRLRPEEPQSLRDLALALCERADARRTQHGRTDERAASDYRRAIELLYEIVLGRWDSRFPEIEVVALMDLNRIVAVMRRDGVSLGARPKLDPRLIQATDVDLRVVLTWDTDNADMDLWVVEPTGEKCYYSNERTASGGMISEDFTGGLGPEEYLIRKAPPGAYAIKADYFGSAAVELLGPTTVQATVYTDFARANERRRALTLRLYEDGSEVDVGAVCVEGKPDRTRQGQGAPCGVTATER